MSLPYRTLPSTRLALETRARVFQRDVALVQVVPATEREREPRIQTLASARWVHEAQDREPAPLVFDVPERRAGDLVLMVDEGDNQPLSIERARLLLPSSYTVCLYRPRQQPRRPLYGHRSLGAPQYDLALLAPQVMGAPATEVYPGPEQPAGAAPAAMTLVPAPVFWGSLATAVIVLLGLIVRLVPKTAR